MAAPVRMGREPQSLDNEHANGMPARPFLVPEGARRSVPRLSLLIAKALGCRRCWISIVSSGGEVVVEDSLNGSAAAAGALPRVASPEGKNGQSWRNDRGTARDALRPTMGGEGAQAYVRFPIALPDGETGVVNVVDRLDGQSFGLNDLELLADLVGFYATAHESASWREVLRLRTELQDARRQLNQVAEQERQRLSRELHDDVGHAITTAILGLDMRAQVFRSGSTGRKAVVAAREVLSECADHVHEFAFQLRPRVLTDLGLAPALRGLARRMRQSTGIDVVITVQGPERRLSEEIELAAFRIAQEAMTNALKHAQATRLTVLVTYGTIELDLKVRDNGAGFDPDGLAISRGVSGQGLPGMRERAQLEGGVLEVNSSSGDGTSIWARLPTLENEPC